MSFFDNKQETINIELTSYGKFLLSRGKFKPVYYAFFDDDIVYDSQYMELTESQNDIQQRIMNETPIVKPQYSFVNLDNTMQKNVNFISEYDAVSNNLTQQKELIKILESQNSIEKNYSLSMPLGRSSYNSDYYPAWNITMISGAISSSAQYVDNSDGTKNTLQPYLKIPQLNLRDSIQDVMIKLDSDFLSIPLDYENIGFIVDIDGETKTVNLKKNFYTIDVLEKNVDDIKENFDIEVYVEENNDINEEKSWKQLNFIKKPVYIKDNILLDTPEASNNREILDENPMFVEHFLNILIDDEIILPAEQKIKVNAYVPAEPDVIGEDC